MTDSTFLQSTSDSQLVKDSNKVASYIAMYNLGSLISKTMGSHFRKEIRCINATILNVQVY